jgi:hypothetical protein
MANKHTASLFKKNVNLCEINREYPCLKKSSSPRHLNTSEPSKIPDNVNIEKLVKKIINEHQENDLNNKDSKNTKEQTEIIELFHEDIHQKMLKK